MIYSYTESMRKGFILPLAIALIFALGLLGVVSYLKFFHSLKSQPEKTNTQAIPPSQSVSPKTSGINKSTTSDEIINEYLNSKYRTLKVVKNPFAPNYLTIVAQRSNNNDTGCGSIYTSPTCYFFLEPDFVYGAGDMRFVAKMDAGKNLDSIDLDSITFENADNITFTKSGGDARMRVETTNRLNLKTGEFTQINSKTTSEKHPL